MYNTNVYAVIVSIYFYPVFWSYDSQCAERHLPHVHWLWRPRNQIIDVFAFNTILIIFNNILLCCNLYLKMHIGLFYYFYCVVIYILKCRSIYFFYFYCVVIYILKGSRFKKLMIVLFVNVPTLNKTFDFDLI